MKQNLLVVLLKPNTEIKKENLEVPKIDTVGLKQKQGIQMATKWHTSISRTPHDFRTKEEKTKHKKLRETRRKDKEKKN